MSLLNKLSGSVASVMAIDRGVLQITDVSPVFEASGSLGAGVVTTVGAGAGIVYIASQMGLIGDVKDTVDEYTG